MYNQGIFAARDLKSHVTYRDEGFHLLHIGEWDNDLSLEILKDWISLIDEDGWVAREQILGDEARSKASLPVMSIYFPSLIVVPP